jgi:hypothetical protein
VTVENTETGTRGNPVYSGNSLMNELKSVKNRIVLSLRPKTLKRELLYGCHSLCFNISFERDIISHVLLFVRLTEVFSSHVDVKVRATHGLYNVLVQLASDAFIYLCCGNCVFKVTCPQNVSSVEAYKSLRGPCVHGHAVYAYDVSPVLALRP